MTKTTYQLNASPRTITGKKVKHLRLDGFTPSTVYGHGLEPLTIQFVTKELDSIFEEAGSSALVEVKVEDKSFPVLFKNPQFDPISGFLLHLDCYKVNLREKLSAMIPLELVGEAPAVAAGNILVAITNEIEVEALPTDLPESIEIDISKLETLDQVICVSDLNLGDKVTIKTDPTQVIVKLEEPKEEVIEEAEAEIAPGDVPATEQKAPEEGEAKTEEDKN